MLSFADFESRVTVIDGDQANELRAAYIRRFIHTEHPQYDEYITTRRAYSDGCFYIGYLWDFLRHHERITEGQVQGRELAEKTVYVFWDLHSGQKILIPNYWRFPRDAVLKLNYADLLVGAAYLPEDIYIFDETMEWSVIFTHEYDDDQVRFYYRAS